MAALLAHPGANCDPTTPEGRVDFEAYLEMLKMEAAMQQLMSHDGAGEVRQSRLIKQHLDTPWEHLYTP